MRPLSHSDGHDAPWLADEVVPGEAAVVDDVVVGFDPKGGEANILFDSQLSRMNCHRFSTGLSSGHRGGSGNRVMLGGTTNAAEPCHPA
jgi:hypothetical protein